MVKFAKTTAVKEDKRREGGGRKGEWGARECGRVSLGKHLPRSPADRCVCVCLCCTVPTNSTMTMIFQLAIRCYVPLLLLLPLLSPLPYVAVIGCMVTTNYQPHVRYQPRPKQAATTPHFYLPALGAGDVPRIGKRCPAAVGIAWAQVPPEVQSR